MQGCRPERYLVSGGLWMGQKAEQEGATPIPERFNKAVNIAYYARDRDVTWYFADKFQAKSLYFNGPMFELVGNLEDLPAITEKWKREKDEADHKHEAITACYGTGWSLPRELPDHLKDYANTPYMTAIRAAVRKHEREAWEVVAAVGGNLKEVISPVLKRLEDYTDFLRSASMSLPQNGDSGAVKWVARELIAAFNREDKKKNV